MRKNKNDYSHFICEFTHTAEFKELDHFDYFHGDDEVEVKDTDRIVTITDFGSNEGVYIDFYAVREIWEKGRGRIERVHVATAKDLSEGNKAFIENHVRAAKISLMLNDILWKRQMARIDKEREAEIKAQKQ